MFTLEEIKRAHSKVKSGADFPAYITEIKTIGVTYYEAFVADGSVNYFGADNFKISSEAKYNRLAIAETAKKENFKAKLKSHQNGETNYPTFCADCAESGIEKWVVSLELMACTYFDRSGNAILVENIPQR